MERVRRISVFLLVSVVYIHVRVAYTLAPWKGFPSFKVWASTAELSEKGGFISAHFFAFIIIYAFASILLALRHFMGLSWLNVVFTALSLSLLVYLYNLIYMKIAIRRRIKRLTKT